MANIEIYEVWCEKKKSHDVDFYCYYIYITTYEYKNFFLKSKQKKRNKSFFFIFKNKKNKA